MCYDISFTAKVKDLISYFPDMIYSPQLELDFSPGDHIIGHGYPEYPIISRSPDGLQCRPMEWGVIPFYVKDEKTFMKQRPTMLNARAGKILDDPRSYWNKIKNRRCLIPVTGIYEHRGIVGWKKKVPYFINLKDQPIFFLPGLYSTAELPDMATGEMIKRYSFTLITRSANSLLTNIHNDGPHRRRMPLFLPNELSREWVEQGMPELEYRKILDYEMNPEAMDNRPVFTIRSPQSRPDGKPKTEYWKWEKLPTLGEGNPPEKSEV